MPSYYIIPKAQEDLKEIRRYTVEKWGAEQANKYLSSLRDTLQVLLKMPGIGRSRADDLCDGIFSYPYASHMIYYRWSENRLIVIAVLHNRMVPAAHMEERY